MGEGEKFIRQILPGLLFLIFSGIQIYSFMPEESFRLITEMNTSSAIIGVVVLGGVGYIFSNIYFVVTHLIDYTVSHVEFVQDLVKNKIISLYRNGKEVTPENNKTITQEEAWSIINTIWYVTLKKDEMDRVTVPISRLSHLLHGIGISFVSLLSSIIICFFIFLLYGCCDYTEQFLLSSSISTLFLVLLGINYHITKKKYYSFVNSVVATSINEFKNQPIDEAKPKEVIIHYSV